MPRPNVLWIMTDQHHADCLGFQGRPVRTPHLDRLASEGVTFESAYCNNPICAPSRACYVTGQYQHTNGMQGNYVVDFPDPCPDSLMSVFRRNGWRTGVFGKGHIPGRWMEEGFERRRFTDLCDADPFDPSSHHYLAYLEAHGLAGWYEDGTSRPGHQGDLDGCAAATLPYEHSIEHFTGEETLRFLADGAGDERPFFAWMSFQRPHAPMCPAPEYFDLYDPDAIELPDSAVDWFLRAFEGKPQWMVERLRRGSNYPLAAKDPRELKVVLAAYYALIECIDREIGRVLDHLRDSGQLDNTIVVFCADHGDFAGDHGLFHKNFGIYESIHHIPMIVRWPGGPSGTRARGIVESVDLFPTLCELADLPVPEAVEGVSMLPVARGESEGKDEALCEYNWMGPGDCKRLNALRTPTHRIVYSDRAHGGELYDCRSDPGEIDNLWDDPAHRDTRLELLERLFDRVNQYRARCEMDDDRVKHHHRRFLPTELVHKRAKDWDALKACYTTRDTARAPLPLGEE